ncbi:MAG: DUF6491 family protein [Pseudomonadota bacterium]
MNVIRNVAAPSLAALCLAACASAPYEPIAADADADADPRLGDEVRQACVRSQGGFGGGFVEVDDRYGFVTGRRFDQYILFFGRGCGDLRPGGAFPIFQNRGNACRNRGEFVQTARGDGFLGAGCRIERIFRWNPDASAPDAEREETERSEDGA